jgi:DNA polymerase-3 subunit beta
MLTNLESKEIELQLSASNKAGLIVSKDKEDAEDILMLVMPVMLSNYE